MTQTLWRVRVLDPSNQPVDDRDDAGFVLGLSTGSDGRFEPTDQAGVWLCELSADEQPPSGYGDYAFEWQPEPQGATR